MKKDDKASKEIMGLPEFIERFGTEEQCQKHLFEMRFVDGFVCPKCGCTKAWETKSNGVNHKTVMQCSMCRYQASATVGTMMHDSKMPIRKWYLAIYLITVSK